MTVVTKTDIPLVDLKAQYRTIKDEVRAAIDDVLEGMQLNIGPNVKAFDQEFAAFCGAKHAIGVGSGTDALQLSIRALGIASGDEVITVSHTFFATVEAVLYSGARPILVDVDEKTFNMDIAAAAQAITPRTKAIMPVHLYGRTIDMKPLLALAKDHGLQIIEDACQSHGATLDTGGVARLDEIQAAILRIKLRRLPEWNKRRQAIARHYNEQLAGSGVILPELPEGGRHVFHLYVVRVPAAKRDPLRSFLSERGIGTGVHYPVPIHLQEASAFLGYRQGDFPVTERLAAEVVSLPMYAELSDAQVETVAGAVKEFMRA